MAVSLLLIVITAKMPIGNPSIQNGYLHVPMYRFKPNGADTVTRFTLEAPISKVTIRHFTSFPMVSGPARLYEHDEDGRQNRDNPVIMDRPVMDLVWRLESFDRDIAREAGVYVYYEDTAAESQNDLRDCICELLRSSGVPETGREGLSETGKDGCLLWDGEKVQDDKVLDRSSESF